MQPLCLNHSSLIVAQPPLSATLTATASSIFLGRLPPSMYSRVLQLSLSWSKSSPMVCWEPGQIMLRARGIVRNGEDMGIYSKGFLSKNTFFRQISTFFSSKSHQINTIHQDKNQTFCPKTLDFCPKIIYIKEEGRSSP